MNAEELYRIADAMDKAAEDTLSPRAALHEFAALLRTGANNSMQQEESKAEVGR